MLLEIFHMLRAARRFRGAAVGRTGGGDAARLSRNRRSSSNSRGDVFVGPTADSPSLSRTLTVGRRDEPLELPRRISSCVRFGSRRI